MLESVRLTSKVIEVGSVEALPKFAETYAFYYVNAATPSWWRWHHGAYREYEPSMFPGPPYLLPKMVNTARYERYDDMPKQGCVGTRYDLDNGSSFFWDYATGKYIQISGISHHVGLIEYPTLVISGESAPAGTVQGPYVDAIKDLFRKWWLKEIDDAHYFNEMTKVLPMTSAELGLTD